MSRMAKEEYKRMKDKVEVVLKNYPYYLIALENPEKIEDDYKRIVNAINYVYERLDTTSKRIVDMLYYRDDWEARDIQKELMIDKNKFYDKKKKALDKFIIVLDNIC
ncbi:nitroreductase [Clostridium gasigenes]|nr:nitroreductase [Clostridium gasigenes]